MTPDEARKDCRVCGELGCPCRYHLGYEDGYEAAQRDQHARTIRGMDPNASASPPGMPTAYPACPDCYHPDVNHYAKRDGARRCSLCLDWGVGAHDKSGPGSPRHFAPEEPQPRPPGRRHG